MQKSLLALAVLGAFAGTAAAQSSVTLFGGIDLAVRSAKVDSTSETQMATDGVYSSRLGFRGEEDLGAGMKAGFHVEGAMTPDDGTAAGQKWQRRTTASLMGGFGEVRLGRDYTPQFWNLTVFDPFGTNGVGNSNNMNSALGTGAGSTVRANNSIGYFLPGGLGGLYGQIQFALGEDTKAAAPTGNKSTGLRVGYAAGPLNVAFATSKNQGTNTTGDDLKTNELGGSYDLGVAKLMAQWNNFKAANSGKKQTNILLGAVVPVGPAGKVKVSYDKANASGAGTDDNDATLFAVGYEHTLSKRTALYANFGQVKNKGTATFKNTSISNVTQAGGVKTSGYEFGVYHTF